MIWSQMKDIVRKTNLTFRYDDVLQATNAAATAAKIGVDRWRAVCDHFERHIQTSKTNDHVVDDQIDPLIINLRDDTSDSSKDELWNYSVYKWNKKNVKKI